MIKCKAINDKSLFVNSYGQLFPCCWVWRKHPDEQKGTLDFNNQQDFDQFAGRWNHDPHPGCVKVCGTDSQDDWSLMKFQNQFKK
jgi:hypothetical protein